VLEVVGSGIQGFSGAGGTKVFWAPQGTPSVYRVIVVGETAGDLPFSVSVQDLADRKPRATVVSLVDLNNLPVPVTKDHKVKFTN
jgi:hypothetical protein